jgi:RluA family pseudouridine synthase
MQMNPNDWVLWSDDALIVINKPAGLPTLPDGYDRNAPHVKSVLAPLFGPLWIVHRLDRETSGVLLLARSASAPRALNTEFDQRRVTKIYHALVVGNPTWETQTIELPLRPNGDRRHRTVVDHSKGKPAITELRVLERLGDYALLEAAPKTGRTHQIRAHLAAEGLPIVVDALYGGGKSLPAAGPAPGLTRMGLHAYSLTVTHPLSGQSFSIEAPYPEDMASALARLRA